MAESTLTLGYPEIRQAVAYYLSFGTTIANWTATQEAIIEAIVQTGYRRVLYPFAADGNDAGYNWSFLRPTTTLAIVADVGDYDLPDDYGSIIGELHYAPDKHKAPIKMVSLATILDMRSASDRNQAPYWAATRYKASDGTAGQKQEILTYPESDDDYTLYYSYDAYAGVMSDAAPYPLGGMQMSEVYKESCLAVAESRNGDEIGLHNTLFKALLDDAIMRDKQRGTKNFGQMGQSDYASARATPWRRGSKLHDCAYEITYGGVYL